MLKPTVNCGGVIRVVRDIKCPKCGLVITQRQQEGGRYEKVEKCPRCGNEVRFIVLRNYMG